VPSWLYTTFAGLEIPPSWCLGDLSPEPSAQADGHAPPFPRHEWRQRSERFSPEPSPRRNTSVLLEMPCELSAEVLQHFFAFSNRDERPENRRGKKR